MSKIKNWNANGLMDHYNQSVWIGLAHRFYTDVQYFLHIVWWMSNVMNVWCGECLCDECLTVHFDQEKKAAKCYFCLIHDATGVGHQSQQQR